MTIEAHEILLNMLVEHSCMQWYALKVLELTALLALV